MIALAKIWQIAVAECAGAVRSRRALVTILLYLVLSVLAMNGTISAMGRMEKELVTALRLPESEKTGIVSATIWKSKPFRNMVRKGVGDEVFEDIAGRHPVELFYAWLVFAFMPLLAVMVAGNRISDDLRSGAARYMLVRATRAEWAVGKFVGQVLMTAIALAVSALGAWVVALFRLSGVGAASLLTGMFGWGLRALVYSVAWLGVALGLSQTTHSGSRATAFGIVTIFVFLVLTQLLAHYGKGNDWRVVLENFDVLIPYAPRMLLWRRGMAPLLAGAGHLFALGVFYFSLGHVFLARRDA